MGDLISTTLTLLAIGGGLALVTTVVCALIRRRIRYRRDRAAAQAAVLRLGPAEDIAAALSGTTVTLRGVLHDADTGVRRLDDGQPCAICALAIPPELAGARSADSVHSVRGETLYLQIGEHRVQLDGEVELLVGSHEARPTDRVAKLVPSLEPEPLFRAWRRLRPVVRSVRSGDEVAVHGRFERRVEELPTATGYRRQAARLSLRGPTEAQPLAVAATAPPTRASSLRRTILWAPLLAGGLSLAPSAVASAILLVKGFHLARTCDEDGGNCRSAGLCRYDPFLYRCLADSDEHCRQSSHCREFGDCALSTDGERCRPGSEQDCQRSLLCQEGGFCSITTKDRLTYCNVPDK